VQTPPLTHLFALECQLQRIEREGALEGRWRRHAAMLALVEAWVRETPGFDLLAPAGRRSASVSALVPPSGTAGHLLAKMRARGFTLAGGLGGLTDRLIRIGHMGDATAEGVSAALAALAAAARDTM
jgi:aspartate aminotransferase-like enzyme